jgi:hypothetical protein
MCDACKTYEKQSEIIEEGIKGHHHHHHHSVKVDEEQLKKQIQAKLQEAHK